MPKKTEVEEEVQATPIPQQQTNVIDERQLPKVLISLIENSTEELQSTQQRLMAQINEASQELMELLDLKIEEGWLLDVEGSRFVRVEQATE